VDRAGLGRGDILVTLNGEPAGTVDDVHRFLARVAPETPVRLGLLRGTHLSECEVIALEAD
jgi:S1-C subfamily serine protease